MAKMSDDPLYMPAFAATNLDTDTMKEQPPSVDASDMDLSHRGLLHPPYEPIPGVPLGLEPLEGIDAIVVQQQVEIVESNIGIRFYGIIKISLKIPSLRVRFLLAVILEIEMNNCYSIFNQYGQRLFFAAEQSGFCTRICLGRSRSYVVHIFDSLGQEIIIIKSATTGEVLGRVKQICSYFTPTYEVFDGANKSVLMIRGPAGGSCFATIMCLQGSFNVFSKTENEEEQIGAITKNFGLSELITESDNFGIRLPGDLEVNLKATLLGAVFCIDFSYYENFYDWPPSGFNGTLLFIIICICVVLFVITL